MYLGKELCDLKLKEIAKRFGIGSYGAVGWACHGVASRIQADAKFQDGVGSIRRSCQQKDLTPFFLLDPSPFQICLVVECSPQELELKCRLHSWVVLRNE